ncbi:MAG TPA: flagellar basal body P-ring formation chaperone FlgA [Rhizomicrobium sp.]
MIRAFLIALAILALPVFANLALAGDAGTFRIVVPAHAIARGDTISDSDLTYVSVGADQVQAGVVTSMNDLDGMQTRRVLRAGEAVRPDDVRKPILVAKGTTVTMEFDEPGITLTAVGKAVSEGGLGETITVLNPVSYRQISCIVTGAGTVRAGDTSHVLSNAQVASIQH